MMSCSFCGEGDGGGGGGGYETIHRQERGLLCESAHIMEVWLSVSKPAAIRITALKKENQEIKPQELEQKPLVISSANAEKSLDC